MKGEDAVHALARDRSHGASELTRRAAAELGRIARTAPDPIEATVAAGVELVRGQPAMAPLFNLVNDGLAGLRLEGADVFGRLAREHDARQRALAEEGAGLLEQDQTIATFSRSGSVLAAVRLAVRSGRRLRVLVSEARPTDEGLASARELAAAGARVTTCIDTALPHLVARASLVVVGADALCAGGLVNKIGTGLLARAAMEANVPFVVLAGADKFLPARYADVPDLGATVASGQQLAAHVRDGQPLFEVSPWARVGLIATDEGRVVPRDVEGRVRGMKVAPELLTGLGTPGGD